MDLWAKVWSDPTAGKRCLHWAHHTDLQCEWIRDFQARQCPSHTFDIFAVFQALKPWALSLFVFFIGRTNQVKWAFDDCWLKRFCPWKHPLPIGHWWKSQCRMDWNGESQSNQSMFWFHTFPSFTVRLSTASIMLLVAWTLWHWWHSRNQLKYFWWGPCTETDGQEFIEEMVEKKI